MKRKTKLLFASVCLVLALVVMSVPVLADSGFEAAKFGEPLTVFINGKVITVDEDFSIAEALAIRGDKVVAVGSNAEIKRLIRSGTEVVDLEGKMVMPGMIDSHMHPGGIGYLEVNCRLYASIAEIVEAVAEKVAETEPGQWVTGSGWDQSKLEEQRFITKYDLDPVSPDTPVYLMRICYHIAVVNQAMLDLCGITAATPDPPGGVIDRDPVTGEPTGVLREAAKNLAYYGVVQPPPTWEQLVEGARRHCNEFNAAGLTSIHTGGTSFTDLRQWQDVRSEGNLTVRFYGMNRSAANLNWDPIEDVEKAIKELPYAGFGDEWLQVGAIKIVTDGGVGGRTAYVREPYLDEPDNYGVPTITQERLTELALLANKHGMRLGIHACGGAAMDMIMNAYRAAHAEESIKGKRWYIIHAYFPDEQTFIDAEEMGICFAVQPGFIYSLGDSFVASLGYDRASYASPHRDYLDEGCMIAGSSDFGVSPYDPFLGIWAAVNRIMEVSGEVLGPEQCITVEEAIRMYTINGAYMTFEEDIKGSIEPGKLADLVVIDRDILTIDPTEIKDIQVLMTMVGGEIVYEGEPVGGTADLVAEAVGVS